MELADLVYDITEAFPKHELFGLTSQTRRAVVSVASNIAEGSQQTSDRQFANFISIAKGSLAELLTQMIISKRRKYLPEGQANILFERMDEIGKMLYSFHRKLSADR